MGRGGLYHRQYLGSNTSGAARGAGSSGYGGTVHEYEQTDVTFAAATSTTNLPRLKDAIRSPRKAGDVYAILLILSGILVVLATQSSRPQALVILGGACLLVFLWAVLRDRFKKTRQATESLANKLQVIVNTRQPISPEQATQLSETLADRRVPNDDQEFCLRSSYLHLMGDIIENNDLEPGALALAGQLEKVFGLPPEFYQEARRDAFQGVYLQAVSDRRLTSDEEAQLSNIRAKLQIPDTAIEEQLSVVRDLQEIRSIRAGQLPTIRATVPLQPDEICHFEGPVRVLKERNLRSYQQAGQRISVRGLTIDKEGTILLTSKRVLIVHGGTTTIPYAKVLAIEVDYDRNFLTLARDGVRSQTLLTTPESMKAGAIIAQLANV